MVRESMSPLAVPHDCRGMGTVFERNETQHRLGARSEKEEAVGDNFLKNLHTRLAKTSVQDAIFWIDDGTRFKARSGEFASRSGSRTRGDACQAPMRMPDVSYNPTLNPLEVRVKCSKATSHNESWQVVIASNLQPDMTSKERVASHFLQQRYCAESTQTPSGADVWFDQAEPSHSTAGSDEREPESYSWTHRPSESSSLCLDDLTDIDILSQISAYYG